MQNEASLVALHLDKVQPRYRDQSQYDNDDTDVPGLRPSYLSAILETPEVAIPSESRSSSA